MEGQEEDEAARFPRNLPWPEQAFGHSPATVAMSVEKINRWNIVRSFRKRGLGIKPNEIQPIEIEYPIQLKCCCNLLRPGGANLSSSAHSVSKLKF